MPSFVIMTSHIDYPELLEREELLYMIRLAEESERYDDMVKYIAALVRRDSHALSVEERAFFSTAYQSVVGSIRCTWRILKPYESSTDSLAIKACAKQYTREIETE